MRIGLALSLVTFASLIAALAMAGAYITYPIQPTCSLLGAVATIFVFSAMILMQRRIVHIALVANARTSARVLLGLNVVAIGTVLTVGASGLIVFYVHTNRPPQFSTIHIVSVIGLGILCFLFILWGSGIALNILAVESLADLLSDSSDVYPLPEDGSVRPMTYLGQFTVAGWCSLLIALGLMIGLGIPLIAWLYQGNRPQGVPPNLLAAPVLAIGVVAFLLMAGLARIAGLALTKNRSRDDDP